MPVVPLINGAVAMGCLTAGLFFLQFWKRTHDRLFAYFGVAFWILGADWAAIGLLDLPSDVRYSLYLPRLLAFLLIIVGIVEKNRSGGNVVR